MKKIANKVTEFIGNTPLLEVKRFSSEQGIDKAIVAKVEFFNPGGSVKDRIALAMVEDAEATGLLKPGGTIIEPTSGNTGVGLALVSAVKGYRFILTMPETMSVERRRLAAAYGAEIELTPGTEGMVGAVKAAEKLRDSIEGAVILQQFENPANPKYHYEHTGVEIWEQSGGDVDIIVAGVGTGGTVSGVGKRLKENKPDVKVVAVEPASSPLLSTGQAGKHKIQGIGANFVPKNYDASVVDEVLTITDEEAFDAARKVARQEGLLVGISSGASLAAAVKLAKRPENKSKTIVAILPDTGERYLSTGLFE